MARTNRFRAEDQLSALLVENRLTNDRNLCQLFDEQVKRTPKSALDQCSLLFEFSSFFIQLNSYRVWHSRLGSTERPTGICVSHGAIATRMVNIDFHSIVHRPSLNSLVSVFSLSEESSSVGGRGAGFGGRFALMITKMKQNTTSGKTLLVPIVQKRVCYSCTFHGRKVKSYNDVLARCLSSEEKNRALTWFRSTNESGRTSFAHAQELLMNIFKVHQGRLTISLPPPWQRGTLFTRLVSAKYNRPHRLIG